MRSCLEDEFILADLDGELLADLVILGDVCKGSRRDRVRVASREGRVRLPLSRDLRAGKAHVPFWILLRALAWDSRLRCISRTAAGAVANDDAMAVPASSAAAGFKRGSANVDVALSSLFPGLGFL